MVIEAVYSLTEAFGTKDLCCARRRVRRARALLSGDPRDRETQRTKTPLNEWTRNSQIIITSLKKTVTGRGARTSGRVTRDVVSGDLHEVRG